MPLRINLRRPARVVRNLDNHGRIITNRHGDLLGMAANPELPTDRSFSGLRTARRAAQPGRFLVNPLKHPGYIWRNAMRGTAKFLPLEVALGGAAIIGGGIVGAANWGSQTGLEEDYTGGAVYGMTKEAGGAVGSFFGSAVGAIGGTIIAPGIGTVIGGVVGGFAGYDVGRDSLPAYGLGRAARSIHATAMATRRVSFGRSFVDSQPAYTMRQMAIQEMSGSLMNARQYFGNEAIYFHDR
jgi:hypothetical protein